MKKTFLLYILIIFLLLLSSFNLNSYFSEKKVLGVQTENNSNQKELEFWNELLRENPNYIPGLIEVKNYEKIKQVDPNYFLQP